MIEHQLPSWVTADIDLGTPSLARVYDFLLGGSWSASFVVRTDAPAYEGSARGLARLRTHRGVDGAAIGLLDSQAAEQPGLPVIA